MFSILIANFNNGRYFPDCFNSIVGQTCSDFEVIIVDDASTDGSYAVIEKAIAADSRFKLFRNEQNFGCGYTKRKCASIATGEVLAFLDPDDTLFPNALEVMLSAHDHHADASLVHSSLFYCDEQLKVIAEYKGAKQVTIDSRFTNLDNAVTAFASFKKSYYLQTTGIAEGMLRAVDQDLYLKLAETGPFHFVDQPLYSYRLHAESLASNNGTKAIYWHLKVVADAEIRRNINLEDEVQFFLKNLLAANKPNQQVSVKQAAGIMWNAFKKSPLRFFKTIAGKEN